jgi:PAS domain-containing protein
MTIEQGVILVLGCATLILGVTTAFFARRSRSAAKPSPDGPYPDDQIAINRLREHFSVIANNVPIVTFAVNRDLVFTLQEGKGLESVGLKPGEFVGHRAADAWKEAPQIVNNFRRALAGETFVTSVSLRGRIFDAWYGPTKDEQGEVIGAMGFAHDVTERYQAAESLQRALSLTEATLDSTADGLLVIDLAGKIVRSNRKFAELWRIPPEVMAMGEDERALNYVMSQLADPEGFIGKVNELYAQPEASSQDVIEFRDGRVFDRYSQPQKLNGVVIGRVWSFRDITAQRRAELELQARNRELEKTTRFLSGREKNLADMKKELQEIQEKCGIVKGDKEA